MEIRFGNIVLRYGVFVLLVLMCAGMMVFVCSFELRVRAPIHLFYDGEGERWHGYVARHEGFGVHRGDTLLVVQTAAGDVRYVVDSIVPEPSMWHITLLPVGRETVADSYREGFVFVGRRKMISFLRL